MRDLRPVLWWKGMFLTPQHFQAQDRYFEELLQFRLTRSLFANYGLTSLEIDEEALANLQFRVVRASGMMKDGLIFSFAQTDPAPPSRAVDIPATQDSLDVYLAIRDRLSGSKNFSLNGSSAEEVRYSAGDSEIIDEAGADEKTIQFGVKNFRLLFGGQSVDGYQTLRIARLVRRSGAVVLDPDFIPPSLEMAGNAGLMKILKNIIEVLAEKGGGINVERRQRMPGRHEYDSSETTGFWLLYTANTALAELNHIYEVRRGHPEFAYVVLLRLAAALSTFSVATRVRDLPKYNHDDLQVCFSTLESKIRELVRVTIPRNCISIPLQLTEPWRWKGTIPEDVDLRRVQIVLSVSSKLPVDKVEKLVKISDFESLKMLVDHAINGLPAKYEQHPPPAINVNRDHQYFLVSQTAPFWDKIRQSKEVGIFTPAEITNAKPEFFILLEES